MNRVLPRVEVNGCNVARHPTADWVIQQLREAFPEAAPYRYALLDRDAKFDHEVILFFEGHRTDAEAYEHLANSKIGLNPGIFGDLIRSPACTISSSFSFIRSSSSSG